MWRIRIHSWGGFGSQLNALALALHIRNQFKSRDIEIVIHTSGVTKRNLEIDSITPPNITLEVVDDYKLHVMNKQVKKSLRSLLALLLEALRIVVKPNDNSTLKFVRFWTLSLRGHYAYITFNATVLNSLLHLLQIKSSEAENTGNICHYRLGDLLNLDKDFISPTSLKKTMAAINEADWTVFSDSQGAAQEMLMNAAPTTLRCLFLSSAPLEIIRDSVNALNFVGTNSKLSIWISIFRAHLGRKSTHMPESLRKGLALVITKENLKLINFY